MANFIGAFLGAIVGSMAIGVILIVIGGSVKEYEPHDKE